MQIGPWTIGRTDTLQKKGIPLQPLSGNGGWWPYNVREPYAGAWQRNNEVNMNTVLTHGAVFSCVTLIASDIGKLTLRLVQKDDDGIWTEVDSPSFSPFLRKPNRYQVAGKYVEQYITSKLVYGNTYVLKQRDQRGVVVNGYVLHPMRVTPLVAPDGSVYYELKRDDLSGLAKESVIVPASEIIHDTMVGLYGHPLMGVSPLHACGLAAMQGLAIQENSNTLFTNGSIPGGILTAPGTISQDAADRMKAYWASEFSGANVGNVAILGDGLHFEPMSYKAVDMQLIEQLKWTSESACTAFKVPAYMIGIGTPPPYANIIPLIQHYHATCLQSLIKNFEDHHDAGLGLGPEYGNAYGVELDINDLFWTDIATRMKAASDGIAGGLSFNEVRKQFHGVGPVEGGDSPLSQQQYFSLAALAERDRNDPFAKAAPAPVAQPTAQLEPTPTEDGRMKLASLVRRKMQAHAS